MLNATLRRRELHVHLLSRSRRSPCSFHILFNKFFNSHSYALDVTHPTYVIWGSNTGVGKTLVSTGLASSVLLDASPSSFLYIKPIQTGFPHDSDARFVYRKASECYRSDSPPFCLFASNHTIRASVPASKEFAGSECRRLYEDEGLEGFRSCSWFEETKFGEGELENWGKKLSCKTLYAWKEAISPHLAVEREGMPVDDCSLRDAVIKCLGFSSKLGNCRTEEVVWRVLETAGGVASPGPSGTLQCDLYRPFRIPGVLVGDGRLGGISSTVSAYETLRLRGYDVASVILVDHGLSNEMALLSYLRNRVSVLLLPALPKDPSDNLVDWFCESRSIFNSLKDLILSVHIERIQRLHDLRRRAGDTLWWPFTQHKLVLEDHITVIDSRCGENFAIHKVCNDQEMIIPQFDACASWWTQGLNISLQTEVARDLGYCAARFGHVMFPENVHEPALLCAERLLDGVGKGWASRVFYSDNGSTAIEIALKLAFRKFFCDHKLGADYCAKRKMQLVVLALNGSYHGDTLGAMEAQAPSPYTSFLQQPWYSGRGLFLDRPTICFSHGAWNVSVPDSFLLDQSIVQDLRFRSCDELFCHSRNSSDIAECYSSFLSRELLHFSQTSDDKYIGALIIEPVVQGAGGMHLIDPVFQRILVRECQIRKIPVIFDEVFTGFWRLGRECAAELLGCLPDIACFGKLLTGGMVPLSVTLTTEAVFEAFHGDSKLMALLHGHSYSAHAIGCTAASKAIEWFRDPSTNPNLDSEKKKMKEIWDMELVVRISSLGSVRRVVALGTLFVLELATGESDSGYMSQKASSIVRKLREDGIYVRPLGNIVYLMCGPCASPDFCNRQLNKVFDRLCAAEELIQSE